jgi:hypothetical protein
MAQTSTNTKTWQDRVTRPFKRVPLPAWWSLPFIVTEVVLVSYGFSTFHGPIAPLTYAEPLRPFLIGADLTIAVFAVNFSFFGVQLSPYRSVLRNLTPRLMAGASLTILFALIPVITTAFSERWTSTVAILTLPVLAYMIVILSITSRTQASAKPQIKILSKEGLLEEFIQAFQEVAQRLDVDPPEFIKADGTPQPVHEMGWRIYPVSVEPDPINELATIAALAADAADLPTYVESVRAILTSFEHLHRRSFELARAGKLVGTELLRQHGADALNRVAAIQPTWDKTGILAHRFTHTCAAFLSDSDFSEFPRSSLALSIVAAMALAAKPLIEAGIDHQAVDTIVVARRIALYGAKHSPQDNLIGIQHRFTLARHAKLMQEFGEVAIANGNVHLLYRCLDGLGFLGCSAAKADNTELGAACLLGLVQLGRLARKNALSCFWDRCALTPEDHAEERIEWIVSWTPQLEEKRRERWGRSVSDALSRLRGFETEVSYVETDGMWKYFLKYSKQPYIHTIIENGRPRSNDFSDPNMIRELVIY